MMLQAVPTTTTPLDAQLRAVSSELGPVLIQIGVALGTVYLLVVGYQWLMAWIDKLFKASSGSVDDPMWVPHPDDEGWESDDGAWPYYSEGDEEHYDMAEFDEWWESLDDETQDRYAAAALVLEVEDDLWPEDYMHEDDWDATWDLRDAGADLLFEDTSEGTIWWYELPDGVDPASFTDEQQTFIGRPDWGESDSEPYSMDRD